MTNIMRPTQTNATQPKVAPHKAQDSFKGWLNDAIKDVNQAQVTSQKMTGKLARGENVDLHDVMIAGQKASISLQTTVEVRNKAVEAYQEIMRMQV
ncbi:flagellar hook-basal body complex protein FliE [Bacillus shivajii]|nr:flagellar hook-basal body complex protein FliE [Bacillus shivajii]